jgi:phospholipid/cholesterol/gamma-HCH transport system ATP-binding protein
VVVSHDIPDIFFISQQVAMLEQGRILLQGSPEEIQQSNDPVVDQFIHGLAVRRDDLTGMATQGQGDRRLNQEWSRFQRHQTALSLLLLTIENMDEIFARIGHEEGQRAFGQFAAQVRGHLRNNDSCSRHDINKILVILPDTDQEQARQVCAKLARKMNQQDIRSTPPGEEVCFNISAGLIQAARNRSLEQMLRDAQESRSPVLNFKVC